MREIKFRGKRLDNGEWVYGYYSPVKLPIFGTMGHFINEDGYQAIEINPDTVGQYTGLKDRNGKEIYEGDIVSIITDCAAFLYKIVFDKGCFCMADKEGDIWDVITEEGIEVIGNIHDNPELLED